MHLPSPKLTPHLSRRRVALSHALRERAPHAAGLILSGFSQPRNYAGNPFGYRPTSHSLYLAGALPEGSALLFDPSAPSALAREQGEVFVPESSVASELWHGATPSVAEWGERLGCVSSPISALSERLAELSARSVTLLGLPEFQPQLKAQQRALLGREVTRDPHGPDALWIELIVSARLKSDEGALEGMRAAARLTAEAHKEGLRALASLNLEGEGVNTPRAHIIRAAMERPLTAQGATPAYTPIITPHGEVLHQHDHSAVLSRGDLLLVDFGAELTGRGCGDVTRVWPVGGRFSPTQRAIYEVVLSALRAATSRVKAGVEYREVHAQACLTLAEGLSALGIFKVSGEEAVERNAHALFFPHGVGHLIGLDVHDMEDLGDLAGYAPERPRDPRFGWGYLRLSRPLEPGMIVTVEPGFYQVPALLRDPSIVGPEASSCVDWERLRDFSDVRGVRLEDDVLVTTGEPEVLSAAIPLDVEAIEALATL